MPERTHEIHRIRQEEDLAVTKLRLKVERQAAQLDAADKENAELKKRLGEARREIARLEQVPQGNWQWVVHEADFLAEYNERGHGRFGWFHRSR